jgi:hypothetical protein
LTQEQTILQCSQCNAFPLCDFGTILSKEVKVYKFKQTPEEATKPQPQSNLPRIGESLNAYIQRIESEKRQQRFEEAENSLEQIARESLNYSEFRDRLKKERGF